MCENQKNIEDDPYFIMELETGYVILGWFQRFRGYTVFSCKHHGPELHDLEHDYKVKFLEEMTTVAEASFQCVQT
jgi:diadenosine tetraphosphate (Ap4A) HIT family hydrolase